jgi:hypothetical protein
MRSSSATWPRGVGRRRPSRARRQRGRARMRRRDTRRQRVASRSTIQRSRSTFCYRKSASCSTTRRVPTTAPSAGHGGAGSGVEGPLPGLRGARRVGRRVLVAEDGRAGIGRGGVAVLTDDRGAAVSGAAPAPPADPPPRPTRPGGAGTPRGRRHRADANSRHSTLARQSDAGFPADPNNHGPPSGPPAGRSRPRWKKENTHDHHQRQKPRQRLRQRT